VTSYALYGTTLRTDESVPELPTSGTHGVWHFSRGPLSPPADAVWTPVWKLRDGAPWLSVASVGAAFHFAFTDTADFLVDPDRRTILNLIEDGPDATVRHLLIDQVLPLLLSLEVLVLHASAVSIDGRAVAFVGPAGAGKSTLALALADIGMPVLSDDALAVADCGGVLTAFPSYPGLRLWPDALGARDSAPVAPYSEKKRLVTGLPFARSPLPLADVYVLRRGPVREPGATRMHPAALLATLLPQAFHLPSGRAGHRAHFERLADASRRMRGWKLTVPDDPSESRTTAGRVIDCVRCDRRVVQ
jgi:hypothetical protein